MKLTFLKLVFISLILLFSVQGHQSSAMSLSRTSPNLLLDSYADIPLARNDRDSYVTDSIEKSYLDFTLYLSKTLAGRKYNFHKNGEVRELFALKTNLLFDALTIVNVEFEVPLARRWSLAAEIMFPWWLDRQRQYCLQILSGVVEGRYWFGNRERRANGSTRQLLTGWFAGLYVGGGMYDIEWGREGIQSEFFFSTGVSGGFAHAIGRNLRMEYSIGAGYMQSNYRRYIPMQSGSILAWQNDGRYSWLGPTRAKVSLVWMIPSQRDKKGGCR